MHFCPQCECESVCVCARVCASAWQIDALTPPTPPHPRTQVNMPAFWSWGKRKHNWNLKAINLLWLTRIYTPGKQTNITTVWFFSLALSCCCTTEPFVLMKDAVGFKLYCTTTPETTTDRQLTTEEVDLFVPNKSRNSNLFVKCRGGNY